MCVYRKAIKNVFCTNFYPLLEETRQRDWDGIVTCHHGSSEVRTWNFQNKCIGKHVLKPKKEIKGTVSQVRQPSSSPA